MVSLGAPARWAAASTLLLGLFGRAAFAAPTASIVCQFVGGYARTSVSGIREFVAGVSPDQALIVLYRANDTTYLTRSGPKGCLRTPLPVDAPATFDDLRALLADLRAHPAPSMRDQLRQALRISRQPGPPRLSARGGILALNEYEGGRWKRTATLAYVRKQDIDRRIVQISRADRSFFALKTKVGRLLAFVPAPGSRPSPWTSEACAPADWSATLAALSEQLAQLDPFPPEVIAAHPMAKTTHRAIKVSLRGTVEKELAEGPEGLLGGCHRHCPRWAQALRAALEPSEARFAVPQPCLQARPRAGSPLPEARRGAVRRALGLTAGGGSDAPAPALEDGEWKALLREMKTGRWDERRRALADLYR